MRALAILLLVITTTACSSWRAVRECPVTPVAVEVERRVYIPVPERLTQPVPIAQPGNRTVRELRNIARARRDAAQQANDQLAEIRALAPPEE